MKNHTNSVVFFFLTFEIYNKLDIYRVINIKEFFFWKVKKENQHGK